MRSMIFMFAALGLLPGLPASAQVIDSQASELRAEMARTDALRVIVTVSTKPEDGEPSAAAKSSQQQLLRALAGAEHRVVFVFPSTPLVALTVGPDALDVLLSHPSVTSIMVDRPRKPSVPPP